MKSQAYFEYLCWDLRVPINWAGANGIVGTLSSEDRLELEAALAVIRAMTVRSFNEGGDNASEGNLAMTMETRFGPPYFGGPERDWNDHSEGFSAITLMKEKHPEVLRSMGFLTEIEISNQNGYFEVRTHLAGLGPIGSKLLHEHSKFLS
jgi:hypothetical protein